MPKTPCLHEIRPGDPLPSWCDEEQLAAFLHEHLKPYEDTLEDIKRGIDSALRPGGGNAGFVLLAEEKGVLTGALVMLTTGMEGFIPPNVLLFVAVDSALRGAGIGTALVRRAQERCAGPIKLHVEYENPARRLYERLGFGSKYAEMRWQPSQEGQR